MMDEETWEVYKMINSVDFKFGKTYMKDNLNIL